MSSGMFIVSELSPNELKTGRFQERQFLAMSEHSPVKGTPQAIKEWLMSLQPDSLVSHSAPAATKKVSTTNEICGLQRSTSFASYSLNTHSWKTSQACLLTNTLSEYSETWPKSGLMLDGVCWEAKTWGGVCNGKRLWVVASSPDSAMLESMDIQKPEITYTEESFRRQHTRAVGAMLSQDDYTRVKRDADDVARGMERLKAIGNGQMGPVAARAWRLLAC